MTTRAKLVGIYLQDRTKKIPFYAAHIRNLLRPQEFTAADLRAAANRPDIAARVNYYNQINRAFEVTAQTPIRAKLAGDYSAYAVDALRALRGFPRAVKLDVRFGDVTKIPPRPTIVKSRPIAGVVHNSVLLKLDSARHFNFVRDPLSFAQKKDRAVWRGNCNPSNRARTRLVQQFHDHPWCDIGAFTKNKQRRKHSKVAHKPRMTLSQQLTYKFIINVEGNDVATNLKWAMSSNSLCIAQKLKYETWFMEGKLIADFHYAQVADDFSDLPQKIAHYLAHPEQAQAIIQNAHQFVAQFLDEAREDAIGRQVLLKYLHHCGQMDQGYTEGTKV